MTKEDRHKFFEDKRQDYIKKYSLKLVEGDEPPQDANVEPPRGNQILPIPTLAGTIWTTRKKNLMKKKAVKKVTDSAAPKGSEAAGYNYFDEPHMCDDSLGSNHI